MDKSYNPHESEDALYHKWEQSGAFQPSGSGDPYTIAIPPPNVTGTLHAGHSMFLTIQDILIRWNRMQEKSALWVPGTDHAAIATESVVLKHLGVSDRNKEISREKFMDEAWKWTKKSHEVITKQVKKMGASCDWSREAFTFDEPRNYAVHTIFKKLYDKGLIYRGNRMVNWSVGAQSVLADDEVEWDEVREPFYSIKCGEFIMGTVRSETKCGDSPIIVHPDGEYCRVKFTQLDGTSEIFIIAKNLADKPEQRKKSLNLLEKEDTTVEIVETIFGKDLVGMEFEYETYAGKRKFFVLADDEVIDMDKGTGSMTISVCHSPDDYALAEKHGLKDYYFQKIDFEGKMTDIAGPCAGMPVEKARRESAKIMQEKNLLVGEDKGYSHNTPICYRSGTVVEPMISKQWFIDVNKEFVDDFEDQIPPSPFKKGGASPFTDEEDEKSLLERGDGRESPLDKGGLSRSSETPSSSPLSGGGHRTTLKKQMQEAVRGEHVKIVPQRFEKTYFHWIDNLRDWCISRQIWWGHRIPVWYDEEENIYLPREQKILLARHGEHEGNAQSLIGVNGELTEKGIQQAEELAKTLKERNITKIISSKNVNALDTAKKVAEQFGLEVEIWEEFSGVDFGEVTGEPESNCKSPLDKGDLGDFKITSLEYAESKETGENRQQIFDRVEKGWKKLKEIQSEGEVLVVAHRTIFSALDALRMGRNADALVENRRANEHRDHGLWGEITALQKPEAEGKTLKQDEDTLDTWFSAALWPFSILGWPDQTPDLEKFYPTDVLETGYDILFFWVARMIMFGKFATGKYPFHTVYLHGLVCDAKGQKMSKSKGNGIDPLEIIKNFGTDALRLSLTMGTTPGNNANLGEEKIAGCRNFCNKLWNISRFILMQTEQSPADKHLQPSPFGHKGDLGGFRNNENGEDNDVNKTPLAPLVRGGHNDLNDLEQWLIAKTNTLVAEVTKDLENYQFGSAAEKLWDFTWNELADWAIEAAKPLNSQYTNLLLRSTLETLLKLWHPFLPFVTEKIWEEFGNEKMLIISDWPVGTYNNTPIQETNFNLVQEVVKKIRSMRKNAGVDPTKKITAYISGDKKSFVSTLENNAEIIKFLARLETLIFSEKPEEKGATDRVSGIEIFLPSSGMIDPAAEKARVEKELKKAEGQLKGFEAKLQNEAYISKAPPHLVEETKTKAAELKEKIETLKKDL